VARRALWRASLAGLCLTRRMLGVTSVPSPPRVAADGGLATDRALTNLHVDSALSAQPKYTSALNTAMGRVLKTWTVA